MIETQLSAYRILDELGSGGMGKVYLAELMKNAAGLDQGQRVALKVVHPHLLETEGFFKRFLREAEIGKSVQQENVVRTYDCDAVLRDGQLHNFLVMEYVEGQTLRDLLKELGTVPEELCRHIAVELAKALQAIHESGVVHRDLKPENVLITKDHVVKVMDLGVARLQDEIIRLSQTGAFVGSVHYAAPEQFKGGGEDLDGRSDLHALGTVLYELASGRHPFQDDDVKVVLRRILSEDPQRLGEINPQLSPFFEEVVHTLLAKERDDRFASAAELLRVLEDGEESQWWKERVKSLRVETQRPLRRVRVPRESALHGRDKELERLQGLYDKAKAGHGQVVLVEGEAGIGRTRLVDEFVGGLQAQGEDLEFLFGSYPPGGAATAAGAFSTAYREQLGAEDLEETLRTYLSQTPLLIPAFAALLRGDATPTGAEPLTKDSLQSVFVHATRALAAERPTVVLIDDLHFAPEDGRALFASLALGIAEHRVLLVGTTRPGLSDEWVANLDRLDNFCRMTLPRLSAKDVGKLVLDVFRSQRLADELGFQIVTKADGNPFFVFEIIRGLREGKFITQEDDGTWVSTQVIKNVQIPSSVMDLIEARVSDLDEEEREILEIASCCGFSFDPSLVANAMGLPILPTLKRFARIEKTHRLIRSEGRQYAFDHHQVQESLYAGLFEQLREQYHAAVAQALESQTGAAKKAPEDLDGSLAVELCEQFFKGLQHEQAMRYLEPALDHLEKGYLNDAAIELADRALEPEGLVAGEARVDLLLRKAARLGMLGRRDEERAVLDEVQPLAESVGSPLHAPKAGLALCAHLVSTGKYDEAEATVAQVLEHARAADDKRLESKTERVAGNIKYFRERISESQPFYERAIEAAKVGGASDEEAASTNNLANVFNSYGQTERSREFLERAWELGQEGEDRVLQNVVMGNLAGVYAGLGLPQKARKLREERLAMSRAIGDRIGECYGRMQLGATERWEGNLNASEELLVSCQHLAREVGHRLVERDAADSLGALYALLGAPEEARKQVDLTREIGEELGRKGEAGALGVLGQLAMNAGDPSQAEAHYREALSLRREGDTPADTISSLVDLGACLRAQSRDDEARKHLDEAISLARELDRPDSLLRALLEAAALPGGDAAEALAVLEEHGERVQVPDRVRVRFLLWQATGDRTHLEEAHGTLTLLRDSAPEQYRDSMIENVPLYRDVMQAWQEQPA